MTDSPIEPEAIARESRPLLRDPGQRHQLGIILVVAGLLPAAYSVVLELLPIRGTWVLIQLHALVEVMCGFAAMGGAALLLIPRQQRPSPVNLWCGCGLLAMGLLNVTHALSLPGEGFVWLRSLATLSGGLLFALVWLGGGQASEQVRRFLPAGTMCLAAAVGAAVVLARPYLPAGTTDGHTLWVLLVHLLAAALFLLAAAGVVVRASEEDVGDVQIFFACSLVLAVASVSHGLSQPWDLEWWASHGLRLAVYIVLARYALFQYQKNSEQLARSTEESGVQARYARNLIEASLDPLVTIRQGGKITDVNRATEEVTGRSRKELIGSDFSDYFVDPVEARQGYERVFDVGLVRDYPLAIRHADGRVTDVLYNATVFRSEAGEVEGVFAAARDITERKRAQEQLHAVSHYARSLIESSLDPLVTISKNGKIMDVNQATEQVTGRSRQELIGSDFCLYFTDPEEARRGYRQAFEQGLVRDYPLAIRHRDGQVTEVVYNATVYRNQKGEVEGVFAAARDVTERNRLEKELQDKNLYTRSLVESRIDALATIDPGGRITDVNRHMEELTGCSREELIGSPFKQYFTDPGRAEKGVRLVLEQGRVTDYELVARCRDGHETVVAYNAATFFNQKGELQGVFAAARDITQRKQAEQELHRLNRALRAISRCTEAVARAGDEGLLLRRVCEIVAQDGGYPLAWVGYAEEDQDKTVRPVAVAGRGADYVRNARITWADTERGRGPTGTCIRSGAPCYVAEIALDPRFAPWREDAVRHGYASVLAIPLREGEHSFGALNIYAPEPHAIEGEEYALMLELAGTLAHGILALRAHQERDRAVAELRQLNATLERRVTQRTTELAASTEEMEAFTYSVSHDLRAPLRHIDGFSKVLLEQCSGQLDDLGRHYLERVRQGTQQMGQLVDDLLNLSRLGRQALHLRPMPLGPMVQEVIEELQAETAGREVEWRIGGLPAVQCDRGLMRQVLVNLLANALKFTRGREPVVIEMGMRGTEVFVRDNGVGFDPQYAGKLFGVFQRLHHSDEFPGAGVGLATVRRILRKHGGDIRAESVLGAGATFYFTVGPPGAVAPPPAMEEASHAA